MKNFFYFLFSFVAWGVLVSCSDPAIEDELDNTVTVNAVKKLLSPTNNSVIDLSDNLKSEEKFEWQSAEVSGGTVTKYEILFFKDNGTSSSPIHTITATNNSVNISRATLDEIAAKAGIEEGGQAAIRWTVRAYSGSVSAISRDIGRIIIKRAENNLLITKLYLTGSGSEYGENLSDAMQFTKVSDNEFYVFSKLTIGQSFKFVNKIDGDNIRSFSVKSNKLVEDATGTKIGKTGVYRIRVDISSKSVEMNEITDVSLFYCIRSRAIKLDYEGRGKWKGTCLIYFTKEAWGDEVRYKFKMTEGGVDKFLEKVSDGSTAMKEVVITDQGSQLWSGVFGYSSNLKEKWADVEANLSNYTHSIVAVNEDLSGVGSSWATMAEKSTSDFVKGYWNTTKRHFNNSTTGTINQYDYWPEAHAVDVIIDAYLRSGDNKYKDIIYNFYEGVKAKNGNKFKNSYYDDMGWHGLAHLRAFEATNDSRYENSARDLWHWILEGWDNENGGIKWRTDPPNGPGVPSTGPATLIAIRRWVKYGTGDGTIDELDDLQWAKRMYEWMREKKHDPATGAVYDDMENKSGAWTYNTGTFLGSAMELYDVTNESHYLEDAIRTADWTLANLSVKTPTNQILSDWAEQPDNDVNLFKGIFIRYFTRLIMNPDLPSDKRNKYIQFIEYNAKALMAYATATTGDDILIYNYGWYFKPKDSFLRGQTSGCMLIEALALLEKSGFL
ncbi:MAG: SusE domain-containing protein [Dysgonamonadaceae bacterium]|nr:SusE domain-containing protein [Dysgonamonadaceae bacterium]